LNLEYLLVVMHAILSSPLTWTHYYTWVLMPIAFLVSPRSPLADGVAPRAIGWAATLLVTPVVIELPVASGLPEAIYDTFAVSNVLFGALSGSPCSPGPELGFQPGVQR
jgi:alpha-1,2-mannosyltransferase